MEVVPKRLCREGVSPSRSLPRDAMPSRKPCQRFDAGYCPILYERASEDSEPCEYSVAGYFWDVLTETVILQIAHGCSFVAPAAPHEASYAALYEDGR